MTEKKEIQIRVKEELKTGVYSNAVSVTVNDNEVIMDMGYLIPGISPTTIEVVSRINMSHATAERFMRVLQNSILDYKNKVKAKAKA